MRVRRLLVLAVLLAAAAAGAWWYATGRPLAVPVAALERDVPIRVFGLGTIEAQVLSRVGFEVPGTLTEVLADHGDRVAAGTVLARLNAASQRARVAKAEAAVLSAEAAVRRAEAQRDRAEALLAQRQATAARRRALAARGSGSVEAAEQAETEAAVAAADLAVNRADAAVAAAALADARATLLVERTALDKRTLTAPYDAVVIARTREPGSALNPGEAVFTLAARGSLWALAHVDEGRAGDLALGQPATVTMRSRPGAPLAGEVVRIGLESDRVTEERRVYVRCRQCPETVYLGEQAEVVIETGRLPAARLVPEAAVHGFDGAAGTVWTIEDGRLARRRVRFAARTLDARLAITDGLPAEVPVAVKVGAGFAVGRAARAVAP
ncbi:efflux RND transporter periplasmic adaptor subunit [Elioraea sp.]|uniref:efflux RND transporter periplasmic adaptor subunit n=2 Tax=Elioraea sp. TaxID=2185103 RepID=UPI0021DCE5E5|nr:HlyD family efflux transporter periplasmic adaptor subunit [Elioraea sp.]GIX08822.1 MAG: RND transporter [Elioraea sp.]